MNGLPVRYKLRKLIVTGFNVTYVNLSFTFNTVPSLSVKYKSYERIILFSMISLYKNKMYYI